MPSQTLIWAISGLFASSLAAGASPSVTSHTLQTTYPEYLPTARPHHNKLSQRDEQRIPGLPIVPHPGILDVLTRLRASSSTASSAAHSSWSSTSSSASSSHHATQRSSSSCTTSSSSKSSSASTHGLPSSTVTVTSVVPTTTVPKSTPVSSTKSSSGVYLTTATVTLSTGVSTGKSSSSSSLTSSTLKGPFANTTTVSPSVAPASTTTVIHAPFSNTTTSLLPTITSSKVDQKSTLVTSTITSAPSTSKDYSIPTTTAIPYCSYMCSLPAQCSYACSLPTQDTDACKPLPTGSAPPTTSPKDDVSHFWTNKVYHDFSENANDPESYKKVFGMEISIPSKSMISTTPLSSYSTSECASRCDERKDCAGFVIYIERQPTLVPGPQCPNPPSTASFMCMLYSQSFKKGDADNKGQWRDGFKVAIIAANGYVKENSTKRSKSRIDIAKPLTGPEVHLLAARDERAPKPEKPFNFITDMWKNFFGQGKDDGKKDNECNPKKQQCEPKKECKSEEKKECKPEVKKECKPEEKKECKPEQKKDCKPEEKKECKPEEKKDCKPQKKGPPYKTRKECEEAEKVPCHQEKPGVFVITTEVTKNVTVIIEGHRHGKKCKPAKLCKPEQKECEQKKEECEHEKRDVSLAEEEEEEKIDEKKKKDKLEEEKEHHRQEEEEYKEKHKKEEEKKEQKAEKKKQEKKAKEERKKAKEEKKKHEKEGKAKRARKTSTFQKLPSATKIPSPRSTSVQ